MLEKIINNDDFIILEDELQRAYLILAVHSFEGVVNNPLGIIFKFGIDTDLVEQLEDKLDLIHWDRDNSVITIYGLTSVIKEFE